MAQYQHLPIWVAANRLLIVTEQAVRTFARYHKVTLGSDLRRQAMRVCRLIMRASAAKAGREQPSEQRVLAVE